MQPDMRHDMNILLVEDNDLDVELLKRGLRKLGSSGSLVRAKDGIHALEILTEDLQKNDLPTPFVILLDINMPRMNGHEFLDALRKTDSLQHARVIVFTTSDSRNDVYRAYKNHANGYIVKPNSSIELQAVLTSIQGFWAACEHPHAAGIAPN